MFAQQHKAIAKKTGWVSSGGLSPFEWASLGYVLDQRFYRTRKETAQPVEHVRRWIGIPMIGDTRQRHPVNACFLRYLNKRDHPSLAKFAISYQFLQLVAKHVAPH
jgi:hypothetical protein